VIVYASKRFLALVDNEAAKNKLPRSSMMAQILALGLRSYAELNQLAARLTHESFEQGATHP
jgi:hypothetical protein